MRGSLQQRGKGRWAIILDLGHVTDPATGIRKRKQKWVSFKSTPTLSPRAQRKQAETKLNELVGKADRNEFVDASKVTLGEWLDTWLEKAVKPPRKRQSTYDIYRGIITGRIKPALGMIRLQALQALDLERYYADQAEGANVPKRRPLSLASLHLHHAILSSALKAAARNRLVYHNVAVDIEHKPHAQRQSDDIIAQSWSVEEARTFLTEAKAGGSQVAAFYALALDSGARRNELLGVKWADVDLETGTMAVVRQLVDSGKRKRGTARGIVSEPSFGPTKTGRSRVIDLGNETLQLLREHKQQQALLKMKNRDHYRDLGLVFAREWDHVRGRTESLGLPMPVNSLGDRVFKQLVKDAQVTAITFHGLRHTCASLWLKNGEPMKVVQERLGHSEIAITMNIYAHVTPGMQQAGARRVGALLHG
jgi:integrase